MKKLKKPWPTLTNDEDTENFVLNSDLTEYDWSKVEPISYEFEKKSENITIRMPKKQLDSIKFEASKRGIKYQKFMRAIMERGINYI